MKIKIYSRGETAIDADIEYQEPGIRMAINDLWAGAPDRVASAITDCTDTERSDISHDEYAIVTEDDGTELWRGWLSGDQNAPAPGELGEAARYFAETWAGLLISMPDDYTCHMTCGEAEAAAGLYRALGYDDTAQAIVAAHMEHDDELEAANHGSAL